MIKLLHLISGLSVGGAELMLYRLLHRMDKQRFSNQVVCLTETGPIGARLRAVGIPVFSLGMRRGHPSAVAFLRLVLLLRREKPTILQTWLYHADLLGLLAASLSRPKAVVWNIRSSNMDMSRYRALSRWTLAACARLSGLPRAIVINSEAGRVFHEQIGYHPQAWAMIPNGVDTDQFVPDVCAGQTIRQELGLAAAHFVIGLMARYDPMKDHATFLRAAGILARTEPSVHFVMAGGGMTTDNQSLTRLIASENLERRAYLLGMRKDIPRLLAACDIATSSSLWGEGFSNAIAEGMACGVPSVATNVGDVAQIIADTGILVPPADPQALADGWRKLMALTADEREQLGKAARERICYHYSLDNMVNRYHELYASLTG